MINVCGLPYVLAKVGLGDPVRGSMVSAAGGVVARERIGI
jgi:hypothetical protein